MLRSVGLTATPVCVGCGYDLSGLDAERVQQCPECGAAIDTDLTMAILAKESARRWRLVMLSPVFALPGLLVVVIGQPMICFALAAGFAYRALTLDDLVHRRPGSRFGRGVQAVGLALVWTLFSTGILVLVGAIVVIGYSVFDG